VVALLQRAFRELRRPFVVLLVALDHGPLTGDPGSLAEPVGQPLVVRSAASPPFRGLIVQWRATVTSSKPQFSGEPRRATSHRAPI
jgi:hypothetical protein